MKQKLLILALAVFLAMLSGCGGAAGENCASREFFAMDTYMTVTAYGDNAVEAVNAAEKRVKKLDKLLNAENKNSEIYNLNKSGRATLSADTAPILQSALDYSALTDGAFNPAMRRVMKLWGFTNKKYNVPSKAAIASCLKLARPDKISLKGRKAVINADGVEVDLGGIAKGYTSSQLISSFRKYGIESGIVNLGGNVQTLGTKPDGSEWSVAIEHPDMGEDYLGILQTRDKAVVTSGGYERCFEENGKTYHHLIDPSTGCPADSGLLSVTVVSADGTLADALSTSLFVMGEQKAREFWLNSSEQFDIILYTDDNRLVVSDGISAGFTSSVPTEVIFKRN